PAPTFQEAKRAAYLEAQFKALGLKEIDIDAMDNVYGLLPGQESATKGMMISAHTDTVFSAETNLNTRRENGVIFGPGLGDNSVGVAGMLGLITFLKQRQITPPCHLWFVATTREEGLGDLGGMKAAYDRLKAHIHGVINLEGLAFGHIYHAGIAVRRLHITANTSGGHSWLHFGRASAIHGIVQLGARITALKPLETPRTTYNIGMIDGGQTINSIATSASLWLDLRSESRQALEDIESQVRDQIKASSSDDLKFSVEIVGDRPAGQIPGDHPLVKMAVVALEQIGIRATLETGSTDGNIPLADGCPTVTIGITRGGNAHRLDEYIETAPIAAGLQQLILLTLAAAQQHTLA
ncbi:MAG: M20/M25/M40 family metallo-hydrolase, partial [Chitinophagaceae bacterium]|nr:M20/M25/M40 family metallo-hydrolase [Anaerolineae bacterium]